MIKYIIKKTNHPTHPWWLYFVMENGPNKATLCSRRHTYQSIKQRIVELKRFQPDRLSIELYDNYEEYRNNDRYRIKEFGGLELDLSKK